MEDKIIRIEEEMGSTTISLSNGVEVKCPSKTIYTIYQSGRKDCKIEIEKPLGVAGLPEKL